MKTCPFCAEDIQDAAIVCKHCGRDLETPDPVVTTRQATSPLAMFGAILLIFLLILWIYTLFTSPVR